MGIVSWHAQLVEVVGSWSAWVSWVQQANGRPVHKLVSVQAAQLEPLEEPTRYSQVPRRVRGRDGVIRPWSSEIGS